MKLYISTFNSKISGLIPVLLNLIDSSLIKYANVFDSNFKNNKKI
jgi:hypothetical protein